jgi:cytoskeletal protein RodZ
MLGPIILGILVAVIVSYIYYDAKRGVKPAKKTTSTTSAKSANVVEEVAVVATVSEPVAVAETPVAQPVEKQDTNAPAACGCGRSETGFCVGLHLLSDDEWAAKTAKAPEQDTVVADAPVKVKKERKPRQPKQQASEESKPKTSKRQAKK